MIIRENYRPGFALVQIMLVAIIITILVGVFVQMTQGRHNERVWAEGNKSASIIQQAVQSYVYDLGVSQAVVRLLNDAGAGDQRRRLGRRRSSTTKIKGQSDPARLLGYVVPALQSLSSA